MEEQVNRFQLLAKKLYDAALEGDVLSLIELLQQDPLILDRCFIEKSGHFSQTPLHVAANIGHLEFTREILRRKPELAEEVDHLKRWSPLHTASAKGHLEIVKALLAVSPNMCLVTDLDGNNPVHVAAIRGQVHVLDELVQTMPQAARERTSGIGAGTILHLCVKHNQTDALKFLVNVMDDDQLLNAKDSDGNTVLHLAVANKQPETVKFLLKSKNMEKNAVNTNGLTAVDVLIQSRKSINDLEIWPALRKAKALPAKAKLKIRNKHHKWLDSQRNALMVVASLIATMAFQVGTNPPGGAWQDNDGHRAGVSIMADVDKGQYNTLLLCNTVGLVSSLSVILLLISGLPCIRVFVGILMITMWIAVTATTVTYVIAVNFVTGNKSLESSSSSHHAVWQALQYSLGGWIILMILLLLGHAVRLVIKLMKRLMMFGVSSFKGCVTMVTRRPFV